MNYIIYNHNDVSKLNFGVCGLVSDSFQTNASTLKARATYHHIELTSFS